MPTRNHVERPWIVKKPKAEQNQSRGGNEQTNFYRLARWRKVRALYLQEHPLCVECMKEGRPVPAKELDHIVPIRLGGDEYDEKNLQGLCVRHHSRKSQGEKGK